MKKWMKRTLLITVIFAVSLVTTAYANQMVAAPGSSDDPLVSKSYVDQAMQQLRQEQAVFINQQIQSQLGNITPQPGTSGSTAVQVMELKAGQAIYGKEGTQFIVRTGKVKVIAGAKGDGIPDLTSGSDLKGNQQVELNHLLLVPRTDKRGLKVADDSPSSAFIIVIGDYE